MPTEQFFVVQPRQVQNGRSFENDRGGHQSKSSFVAAGVEAGVGNCIRT